MRERRSNATNGIEHYIFQWFFHTAALRVQCEYIIEIYGDLIFSVSRIAASLAYRFLCERTFNVKRGG